MWHIKRTFFCFKVGFRIVVQIDHVCIVNAKLYSKTGFSQVNRDRGKDFGVEK